MELYNFLKEYGLKANDIKNRLKNNQVIVNGNSKGSDFDLGDIKNVYDQGFFLNNLKQLPFYEKHFNQILFFKLEGLIGGESNIKNELTKFLSDYKMIQVSKDTIVFIEISNEKTGNINWKLEGKSEFTTKVELPKVLDRSDLVDKIESDILKVNKQLSNKRFLEFAPKFKIEATQNRLENLERKLFNLTAH